MRGNLRVRPGTAFSGLTDTDQRRVADALRESSSDQQRRIYQDAQGESSLPRLQA